MATSRNLAEFGKRLFLIQGRFQKNSVKAIQRAAIAADQVAVTLTPVDTGRAKANWIVSIGKPSVHSGNKPDKSGNRAMKRGRSVIGGYKLGAGAIFIANNLPYIEQLDNGSSTKRPEGMTAGALQAAILQFKKARLL